MATFERKLKVTKTDAFQINVAEWLAGEVILSLSVSDQSGLTTVGSNQIDGALLSVLLTGVVTGNAEIHFTYSTATRSDCAETIVKVIEDC